MLIQDITDQGLTRLWTRRDRLRAAIKLILGLCAAVVFLYLGEGIASMLAGHGWHTPTITARPLFTGHGGLIGAATGKGASTTRVQFPLVVHLPAPLRWAALVALPLWLAWWVLMFRVLWRPRTAPTRHKGLATARNIRAEFGARAVRRSGVFTLPGTTATARWLLPNNCFGYRIGRPSQPRIRRMGLWVNFEQRVRIIAGTGWGKSWRLLIPIIRSLPGPAVIASIEAEIFTTTVTARSWRRPPGRFFWQRLIARPVEYPVAVVDMSSPEARFASGYPQVRWNPIVGCQNFKIATRRAKALIAGGDTDGQSDSSTDAFFRDSASQVLAAWLHAAAFDPAKDIDDIAEWLRDTDLNTPTSILAQHPTEADQTAVINMNVHLDAAGGRTTSGVRRYLNFAVSSLASGQGRELCGSRHGQQFDMGELILAGGTLYLLAEQEEMELARPLLSLFAQEMFMAAERTAQTLPTRRHPQTFMGVLDELKNGVRVPILPHVASAQRKYGISYIYATQTAADEEELYGKRGAAIIRKQAGISVIGGYDSEIARETSDRAGKSSVVTAGRGNGGHRSEHLQFEDTLSISDQQELGDGHSVVLARGLLPFLAHTDRVDHHRAGRRRIRAERRQVETFVTRHRDQDLADSNARKSAQVDTTDGITAAVAGTWADFVAKPAHSTISFTK